MLWWTSTAVQSMGHAQRAHAGIFSFPLSCCVAGPFLVASPSQRRLAVARGHRNKGTIDTKARGPPHSIT